MKNWLKSINKARSRISTQLYLTIGGAVVLTISASLVGWFLLNRVGEVQQVVNEAACPSWRPPSAWRSTPMRWLRPLPAWRPRHRRKISAT